MNQPSIQDLPEQMRIRKEKLSALREQGWGFPNNFRPDAQAADLLATHAQDDTQALEALAKPAAVAGRLLAKRVMGKATFLTIQDRSGRIQLFAARDELPEGVYAELKKWDLGDVIGGSGLLFRTKTGELSVRLSQAVLLTKALRPLPEKWHGLTDQEARYRQRYVNLIVNPEVRQTFAVRSRIINAVRGFLSERGFLEVETPMMQPLAGGAAAKPFVTHHNALDMTMFLRIAPELYLKRLVVGGFDRVFEINRNFRNEGLSTRHNPEFTMLEFYMAYADFLDLMDLTETMLAQVAQTVLGTTAIHYQGTDLDLGQPFRRVTVEDLVRETTPELAGASVEVLRDPAVLAPLCAKYEIPLPQGVGAGKMLIELFEKHAEHTLMQPTFVYGYPTEISPLARRNDSDPFLTDRFELIVVGRELGNAFSELNDAEDQRRRFEAQAVAKAAGDEEACDVDEDFLRALEFGLPPTAGEGIGIDRLVMLLTNSASIRDVILFPHMRPEA